MMRLRLIQAGLLLVIIQSSSAVPEAHKYCIVGAGPGGLQMAHMLQRAGLDYVLFERSNSPGSFFEVFPRHRTLISINKRHTGQKNTEFNLRHDWNSILSDDESLLFTKYSDELFPPADDLVRYLKDYVTKLNITVRYGQMITNLRPVDDGHLMENANGDQFKCRTVVLATGLSKPHIPDFPGREFCEQYSTMNIDPKFYEGKRVLIVGRGNTGFEIASDINGRTAYVHMISRSRLRLSWETHYVGDLRAINNGLLDTYQLKSLDGILETPIEDVVVVNESGKLYLIYEDFNSITEILDEQDDYVLSDPYDHIILATGWTFDDDLFHKDFVTPRPEGRGRKYPKINVDFSLTDRKDVYVVGTASHSLDFHKSAGGFIHGFRYTGRAVFKEMMWRYEGIRWPSVRLDVVSLLPYIHKRMNEASGNYQMFAFLGDIIIPQEDGLHFEYLEEVPVGLLSQLYNSTGHSADSGVIVWLYEYGTNFSGPGKDIFRSNRAEGNPAYGYKSNFLHPNFYVYDKLPTEEDFRTRSSFWPVLPKPKHILTLIEDFTTFWKGQFVHQLPLRRFIERGVGKQLIRRRTSRCFTDGIARQPHYCQARYMKQREFPARSF